MPRVIFGNARHTITVPPGMSLLRAARSRDLPMPPECGDGACRRCQVYVAAGADELSPPTAAELRHLGFLLGQGYRLACQARGAEQRRPFGWLQRWSPHLPDDAEPDGPEPGADEPAAREELPATAEAS